MITVIGITNHSEATIAQYARISRSKKDAKERLNEAISDKYKTQKTIERVLGYGHDNILESVNLILEIEGSRLGLRDILMHRLISPIEMSQRYVKINEKDFYKPKEIKGKAGKLFEKDLELKIKSYYHFYEKLKDFYVHNNMNDKVASGLAKEDARYFLPNYTKTRVQVNANLRNWLYLLSELKSSPLHEHLEIANELEKIIAENFPTAFKVKSKELLTLESEKRLPKLTKNHFDYKVRLFDYLIPSSILEESIPSDRKEELTIFQFELAMSQSATRQFLRHRMQSFMILDESIKDYVLPESFKEANLENDADKIFKEINLNLELAKGIDERIARYMLTNAHKIHSITSLNLRELRKVSALRECLKAQWEIRETVKEMTNTIKRILPSKKDKFGPKCIQLGYCPEKENTCGKLNEVKKEYGII